MRATITLAAGGEVTVDVVSYDFQECALIIRERVSSYGSGLLVTAFPWRTIHRVVIGE